ncbi:MAG: bifunctional phosphopantothenoylcysteine decarboxylase/phosphopantothenate--cysteine ligase CoaBC [Acidobacteriota bacterium]
MAESRAQASLAPPLGTVALGVCGGIAAYKSAELVRRLQDAGYEVVVGMTEHAHQFVTPLTLQVLSRHRVITDPWDLEAGADIEHVALARRCAVFLLAPATANMIGKLANGVADDFLSTFYLATQAPVVIAPGMNDKMFAHPTVQRNLERLREVGVEVVEPGEGYLACGDWGPGRMAEPERIVEGLVRLRSCAERWRCQRVLVTAGPTREPIDRVRFVSNRSSGRMGYALAAAARRRGAEVTLVSGPTQLPAPRGVQRVNVITAEEMRRAVFSALDPATVVIQAAAVSDYAPRHAAPGKPAKRPQGLNLEMVATPDILEELGRRKGKRLLVGFAAETEDLRRRAARKLQRKHLDLIVANDVSGDDTGFEAERNSVLILDRNEREVSLEEAPKTLLAERILDVLEEYLPA